MSLSGRVYLLAALCIAPLRAEAGVLLSESFNYANGPLITVSGGAWESHSGTAEQLLIDSGRALLEESQSGGEDVNVRLAGEPYPSSTNLTLYAGYTVRFTELPNSGDQYFAHLKNSGSSGFRAKLFATTDGAAAGSFRLGITEGSNSDPVYVANNLSLSTDYRVVVRYNVNSAASTLWIDPAAETDPSATATDTSTTGITIVAFALRQTSGIGMLEMDDVVVGTQFNEVIGSPTPQPPVILTPPASQSVAVGASVNFTVFASGDSPLSYQWAFNGTQLSGATNASLLLTQLTPADEGDYIVTVSNALGTTNSLPATLTVVTAVESFSVLNYNVKGNSVEDWSTNSPQVRAIGRQVEYLDPDIITFQEIPLTNTWQMTNFVTAFRPGFYLADNSGTDGFIRSVILSRYPINRSQKWLDGVSLVPFGYNGTFTRDLFEAEIDVPGFPDPVHVFTVHLKSGQGTTSSSRRAAEANAISNYFVAGFLTTNASHPYLLTGDMNEDIANPPSSLPQTLERLTSIPTGLQLTTPVNPFTGDEHTISIQTSLYARYDYILPGGLLFSNILSSEAFRTDLLPSPPPPLLAGDSATASDHLPVLMEFSNPFGLPFRLLSISASTSMISLTWETIPGRLYDIEGAALPGAWSLSASNLLASGTTLTHALPATQQARFFRVLQH